jgi:phospholipase C
VVVVMMENKDYGEVIGNVKAPYVNALARRYAVAGRYYAIRHPSLPNYLALIGGSTFNVTSNCTSCSVDATNLVDQLDGARVSWKAYMEDMPAPCYSAARAGGYAKKHNPFAYFKDIARDPVRCSKVVPYTRLTRDMRRGRLPRFAWITPNECHQAHDCDLSRGDRFLRRLVPRLLRRLGPRGALFLLWDEGGSDRGCCQLAHGGRIPAIVAGPGVRRGLVSRTPFDHYSTLRAIEDAVGLRHLRGAACGCTRSLRPLFSRPPKTSSR